jgi:5-(carboxyamino)imidazole ribonucleotide synthase
LEKLVPFEREIAVIVSRNDNDEISVYPVVDMEFNAEANLVEYLFSPSVLDDSICKKAQNIAIEIIQKAKMTGILAVEMFVTHDGEILVNEIAPRPHNSGHQTIEANTTSQYEQHLRAICNFPPGKTESDCAAVMVNILGEANCNGVAVYQGMDIEISRCTPSFIRKKNDETISQDGTCYRNRKKFD